MSKSRLSEEKFPSVHQHSGVDSFHVYGPGRGRQI